MEAKDIKVCILNYLNSNSTGVSILRMKASLPKEIFESDNFERILSELHINGDIIYTPRGISSQPRTIASMINQVNDNAKQCALIQYFNGSIVDSYNSKQRIALVREFLSDRPQLDEDVYRGVFRIYRFTANSFIHIFNQPISTYIYLKDTCKKGKIDWREMRFDQELDDSTKAVITNLIKDEGILIEGTVVPFNISEIGLFLLKRKDSSICSKVLYEEYLQLLNGLAPLPLDIKIKYQKFMKILLTSGDVIKGKGSHIRYRESNDVQNNRILNKLKLNKYRNKYLSAEIIYSDFNEILQNGNVIGPYELISFMKSFPDYCDKYVIQFPKAPFLVLGHGNDVAQLEALLYELSPITGVGLAKEYERRYGFKVSVVKTKLLKEIDQYLQNGIYDIRTKSLTEKQFDKLSKYLSKPMYYTEEIEAYFKRYVGKSYEYYMSINNLDQLGYRQTNAIIYSNKFKSLEECLDKTIWSGSTFQVNDELRSIPQVISILNNKILKLEIIEYFPHKYIRLSYLKKHGIHKKHLKSCIDAVNTFVEDESYFTLKSLRKDGLILPLEELGFGDIFYHSILKHSNKNQYRKVAETYIFRKSKNIATLPDFIEYLISKIRSINLYDFAELLFDIYGVSLNPTSIRNAIYGTQMYYDSVSEKIFLDYEEYFEEV